VHLLNPTPGDGQVAQRRAATAGQATIRTALRFFDI